MVYEQPPEPPGHQPLLQQAQLLKSSLGGEEIHVSKLSQPWEIKHEPKSCATLPTRDRQGEETLQERVEDESKHAATSPSAEHSGWKINLLIFRPPAGALATLPDLGRSTSKDTQAQDLTGIAPPTPRGVQPLLRHMGLARKRVG